MRPKKPQWFRHDEGNARGLKAQQEWKISLIVRQRPAGLEKKVADLEAAHDELASEVNNNAEFFLRRMRLMREALTPEGIASKVEPPKRFVLLRDNIRTRRARKKK